MIYDIETGVELPRVRTAPHWQRYTRARQERHDLVEAMVAAINVAIGEQLRKERVVNSSWLGSRVLESFPQGAAWQSYVGDANASSTLFGMIMWTTIWDDPRAWLQQLTQNATAGETDRVYWLRDGVGA